MTLPALTPEALSARYTASSRAVARAETGGHPGRQPGAGGHPGGLRHRHLLGFDPNGPGEAVEVLGEPGHRPPGRHPRARLRHVAGHVRVPRHRLAAGRSPGAGRRDRPARSRRPPRDHRLARLPHPQPAQPGRPHLGQRGTGGPGPAAPGDQPGRATATRSRCSATATDRWCAGWPRRSCRSPTSRCTAARAWTPPRCGPCTRRPGCGRPGRRRLDPRRAARPAAGDGVRRGPHRAVVRRPPVQLRRRRAQRLPAARAASSLRNLAYIALGEPGKVTR